jgi:hypothetical protein
MSAIYTANTFWSELKTRTACETETSSYSLSFTITLLGSILELAPHDAWPLQGATKDLASLHM